MRAGEADLLEREHEEQVWTEETCQEQGRTAVGPCQRKDMPTGRYKGAILNLGGTSSVSSPLN